MSSLAKSSVASLRLIASLLGLATCNVAQQSPAPDGPLPYGCQSDDDCSVGQCRGVEGFCALGSGELDAVLVEVTPRATDPVYGGARYLSWLSLPGESGNDGVELNVPPRVSITGRVLVDQAAHSACLAAPSLASATLPVTLTFTPRERLLGLSVPSYELRTRLTLEGGPNYVFEGALPPGRYDVYMRPETAALSEECRAIPQLFRNETISAENAGRLELGQPATSSLRLSIAWQATLEGWTLDVVHPVTGEVISNRVRLTESDVVDSAIVTTLDYSEAENDFILDSGEELVRLTPPDGALGGTVLLQRSGLELLAPGEGAIGDVSDFGQHVNFQSWVWKQGEFDAPVAASVEFTALNLDAVDEGVIAAFSRRAEVDERGEVQLELLPGEYRIRVTPPGVDVQDLGLLAGYESTLTVWPNVDGQSAQAGHVIEVPPAISLTGAVVTDVGARPVGGVEVRATASDPNRAPCLLDANDARCDRQRATVLRDALGEDAFVPRTRAAVSAGNGEFRIDGLDCGQCRPGSGARFDVTARPPAASGLAWHPISALDLHSDGPVGTFRLPVPVAIPMRLTYGGTLGDPLNPPRQLSGALVRVFAVVDDAARVVRDADGLLPCVSMPTPTGEPCLQSLIQLAELRSDDRGELLLLLPPHLR